MKDLLDTAERIKQSEFEEIMRPQMVAEYLEGLAKAVRAGHVLAFKVSWDGAARMDSTVLPRQPAEYIIIDLKLEV